MKKIVVIGPESTGKSTLSQALATELNTLWVPEFARAYLEDLGRPYNEDDLLEIAKGQVMQEDLLITQTHGLLVCDTDLHVIKVWSEHKYSHCHPWILEQIAVRNYDMYLLTDIDIAWQDDPLREHGEEQMRRHFFNVYHDIVANAGLPWVKISGQPDERLKCALEAISQLKA